MADKHYPWRTAYLNALRELPVIKHACEAAGVDRSTAWRARESDPDFADAEREAMEEGVDKAEAEAFRRGVVGFDEPVVDKGRLAYRYAPVRVPDVNGNEVEEWRIVRDAEGKPVPLTIRKHSDTMLALVLKGRRKKVYADRTELTGPDGAPMQLDETTRSARVAQLLAIAAQRKAQQDDFGDLA